MRQVEALGNERGGAQIGDSALPLWTGHVISNHHVVWQFHYYRHGYIHTKVRKVSVKPKAVLL